MRRIIVVLLSIFLVIISMIVACATPPPVPTPTPTPPSIPTPAAAYGPEWDKIVAAAKVEGELTGYGSIFTAERGLQKDFGDKYGIKINGVAALSPALAERIKTEVAIGKQVCDVSSVTFSVTTGMVNDGLLQEAGGDRRYLEGRLGLHRGPRLF